MKNRLKKPFRYLLLLGLSMLSEIGFAVPADEVDSVYDVPEVVAVERRKFQVQSDFTGWIGYLPIDAFNKTLTFGISMHKSFGTHWGWEVFNIQYGQNMETSLKGDIERVSGATVLGNNSRGLLDPIQYYGITSLTYTPVYSKSLFFNKRVLYNETSLVAGIGVVNYKSGDRAPTFNMGVAWRLFTSKDWSVKTDIRAGYHTGEGKSSNFMFILNLGLSMHLGDTE